MQRRRFRVGSWLTVLLFLGTITVSHRQAWADEPAVQPEAPGIIFGRIVDEAGAPIAGALIELYRWHLSPSERWHRWSSAGAPVMSGPTGAYQFELQPGGYFLVVSKSGLAQSFLWKGIKSQQQRQVDVVLKPAVASEIQLTDSEGRPVVGAKVRELGVRGVNGQRYMTQLELKTLGITIPPSDERGRIQLPPLASGDFVELTVEHSQLAPVQFRELAVAAGVVAKATMQPATILTVAIENPAAQVANAVVQLHHAPYDHPSSIVDYEIDFGADGTAKLAIAPGDYNALFIQNDDYYLTPTYFSGLHIEPGRNDNLRFQARRKVPVRGRIIEAGTGRPVSDVIVVGEVANNASSASAEKWSYVDSRRVDAHGAFKLSLAQGHARIALRSGEPGRAIEMILGSEYLEFNVAADGSTVIPDIEVRSVAKVVGTVRNPDGSPAVRAIVRLRGRSMFPSQPVLTDEGGRFEIHPDDIPADSATGKRQFDQQVVAFDPYRPLAAVGSVRLDKPGDVVLRLEPHEPDWPMSVFADAMGDWERGVVSAEEKERTRSISLRNLTPPELDAAAWINTNGTPLKLADLHGKYVLLDFWFTGCGPCHQDFPSVKLVHDLFKDRGVVVIGVHTNSARPLEDIRRHVAELGLSFPVMVDHPDGRTIAHYQTHRIANIFPNYVLIDPEGKVLLDDQTIPHPTLRANKLEIIRKYLLTSPSAAK